jgi:hypothetical protein
MPHTSYGLLKAIRSHTISSPSVQESLAYGRPNACNQCHLDQTLAWTANQLDDWYDIKRPAEIPTEHTTYAAMAVWGLSGDAGQRALSAWSFGWASAQNASRTDWIPPILAQLLADPYEAVRHIARRSLRTLPEFADLPFDYVGTEDDRQAAALDAFRIWNQRYRPLSSPDNRTVLLSPDGKLLGSEFSKLNRARNNREVVLAE